MERSLACLFVAACFSACGGGWSPSGVGPAERDSVEALALAEAFAITLENDIVPMPEPESPSVPEATADAAAPRVFYIKYADGGPQPVPSPPLNYVCSGTPTPYTCTWDNGGVEACKRRIQKFLDAAYQDFNLIFTFERPVAGPFYTSLVTSAGDWCKEAGASAAGVTQAKCSDTNGGISYALRCWTMGGRLDSAQACAEIIAHEQGHLVGLMHTSGTLDIMKATVCTTCNWFAKEDNPASGGPGSNGCRTTQNSYQMMLSALGAWPGGTKPDPFPHCTDSAPPSVTISEPVNGATVGQTFDVTASASDDCSGVVSSRITIGALSAPADGPGPWTWPVSDLTGDLVIKVEATDADGNVGSASINVTGPGSPGSQPDGSGSQPDGSGLQPDGSGSQPDGSGLQTDGEVVVEPPPPAPRSCGCALGGRAASPGAAAALLVTGALALVRRRRRPGCSRRPQGWQVIGYRHPPARST